MDNITFSIVLPTYNRKHMIQKAINSVLEQSYSNWELIIIDDGSNDDTNEFIQTYNDPRIKYHYQDNQGKGPARNLGVEKAIGQYICFLDSDDSYLPNHLSSFYQGINAFPSYKMYRTGAYVKSPNMDLKIRSVKMKKEDLEYRIRFIWGHYFALLDLCIEQSLAISIKSTNCAFWQDKHYIIRLALIEPIKQLSDNTLIINDHKERSLRVNLLTKDDRDAPYKCMDDLLKKEPIINNLIGPSYILKSKIWAIFGQIYNLISEKEYAISLEYLYHTILKYPNIYTFKKTLILFFQILISILFSLIGKKGKYF